LQSSKFLGAASALVMALGFVPNNVHAAGAPAGTVINSTADVSYTVGTVATTANSNLVTVTVIEVIDVNVTAQTANVTVNPGDTTQVSTYWVDNIGNSAETFLLTLNNAVTSDQFDPIAATPAIYLDSGGGAATAGIYDSSDIVYVPGSNDPALAADARAVVFVVNDIPGNALDGQLGISRLSATSRTGTDVPGTPFPNGGNGINGVVDAVIGVSTGTDSGDTTYLIAGVSVTAAKTQAVVDTWGGSRPVPGARINYSIAVNTTGTGTATNVVFTDNIPPNTTYVPGSLALDAVAVTDAVDLPDDGDYVAASGPTPARIRVPLGSLNTAAGTKTVTFSVVIN